MAQVTKAPTIITKVPEKGHTGLCCLRVLTTKSLCLLLLGGIFASRIPFDVLVTSVLQRSVTRLPLSEVRNRGENRQVAITGRRYIMTHVMRNSSQSLSVINFHWPIVNSRFHDIKYEVFWTDHFCTPARSLNTPRWVITRVLPGTERRTFIMIVGVLVTWAIYTQASLLLWSSLIITGVVPGYKWPRWLRLQLSFWATSWHDVSVI